MSFNKRHGGKDMLESAKEKMNDMMEDMKKVWSGSSAQQNPIVLWTIRVVLILLASIVVPMLPETTLNFVDNIVVRLFLLVVIVLLSLYDPASAILLTIAFLVAIQTLSRLRLSSMANGAVVSGPPMPLQLPAMMQMNKQAQLHNESFDDVAVNNGLLPSTTPGSRPVLPFESFYNNTPTSEEGRGGHKTSYPVYHALKESYSNFAPVNGGQQSQQPSARSGNGSCFTTPQQFQDAQSNEFDNNQGTEVRTWTNELGPQGLSQNVMGFNNVGRNDLLGNSSPF